MLRFTADYADRDEISSLGAKFNFGFWQWEVENAADYAKFSRWLKGNLIITRGAKIAAGNCKCPYCGSRTTAAALLCTGYIKDFGSEVFSDDGFFLLSALKFVPEDIMLLFRNFKTVSLGKKANCAKCGNPFPPDIVLNSKSVRVYNIPSESFFNISAQISTEIPSTTLAAITELTI